MEIPLVELYKRYNCFGEYSNTIPMRSQYTAIQILKKSKIETVDINEVIFNEEYKNLSGKGNFQELLLENGMVQPKCAFFRMHILNLIAYSIPATFYDRVNISPDVIVGITMAIVLYYFGLQTVVFFDENIPERKKHNIFGRQDFYFDYEELRRVRAVTQKHDYDKYIELFAEDINSIVNPAMCGLFIDDNCPFIICVEDFVDYMIFSLESIFRKNATNDEYSLYTEEKGNAFEDMVYGITHNFVDECFHTLYYHPNKTQRMEIDVVLKDKNNIAVLECKSGTFNPECYNSDEALKIQIQNKTKKAYRTLNNVTEYIEKEGAYCFTCDGMQVRGETSTPICIHISMYPLDFISSNVHVLFPDYLHKSNPILTLSIEHLTALLLENDVKQEDIFEYFKVRKEYINQYPNMSFDNNELDLYYELANKKTMLFEMERNGFLQQISPHAKVFSSFHDDFGNEVRPAKRMIEQLSIFMLMIIFHEGKKRYGINKRYLKLIEDMISID